MADLTQSCVTSTLSDYTMSYIQNPSWSSSLRCATRSHRGQSSLILQYCEQDLKKYMDTHGDRGALDLNTVKNFTYQLLNVRCLILTVKWLTRTGHTILP